MVHVCSDRLIMQEVCTCTRIQHFLTKIYFVIPEYSALRLQICFFFPWEIFPIYFLLRNIFSSPWWTIVLSSTVDRAEMAQIKFPVRPNMRVILFSLMYKFCYTKSSAEEVWWSTVKDTYCISPLQSLAILSLLFFTLGGGPHVTGVVLKTLLADWINSWHIPR